MKHPLVPVDSSYFLQMETLRRDLLLFLAEFELDYEFAVNGIVWADVLCGRSDPHVRNRYDHVFSLKRMLHLTSAGWQRVARLAWELDRRGEIIPLPYIIIGLTALSDLD